MSSKQFSQILNSEKLPNVILITSNDFLRRNRKTEEVILKFIPEYSKNKKVVNLDIFNSDEVKTNNIRKISDNSQNLSLFASEKYILIKNAEKLTKGILEEFKAIFKKYNNSLHFIFSSKTLNKTSLLRKIIKAENIIEYPELSGDKLNSFIKKEIELAGINKYYNKFISDLVHLCESDLDAINHNLKLLSQYSNNQEITSKDFNILFSFSAKVNEFEILNQLTGDNKEVESKINKILSKGFNSFGFLSLLHRNYANFFKIAADLKRGVNPGIIQKKLKLPKWLYDKQVINAKKIIKKDISSLNKNFLVADSKFKNKSLGDEAIFSELINNLNSK